jgi:hypothetical protein
MISSSSSQSLQQQQLPPPHNAIEMINTVDVLAGKGKVESNRGTYIK